MSLKRGRGLSGGGLGRSTMGVRRGGLGGRGDGLGGVRKLSLVSGFKKKERKPGNSGIRFEQHIVDLYNAHSPTGRAGRQRGSGAQWFRPGDILTPEFLIESKGWKKPIVQVDWLQKVLKESFAYPSRVPVLVVKAEKRIWAILRDIDIPAKFSIPKPMLTLEGGATQATIPNGEFDSFELSFEGVDQSYVGIPLLLLFSQSNLFLSDSDGV